MTNCQLRKALKDMSQAFANEVGANLKLRKLAAELLNHFGKHSTAVEQDALLKEHGNAIQMVRKNSTTV